MEKLLTKFFFFPYVSASLAVLLIGVGAITVTNSVRWEETVVGTAILVINWLILLKAFDREAKWLRHKGFFREDKHR